MKNHSLIDGRRSSADIKINHVLHPIPSSVSSSGTCCRERELGKLTACPSKTWRCRTSCPTIKKNLLQKLILAPPLDGALFLPPHASWSGRCQAAKGTLNSQRPVAGRLKICPGGQRFARAVKDVPGGQRSAQQAVKDVPGGQRCSFAQAVKDQPGRPKSL